MAPRRGMAAAGMASLTRSRSNPDGDLSADAAYEDASSTLVDRAMAALDGGRSSGPSRKPKPTAQSSLPPRSPAKPRSSPPKRKRPRPAADAPLTGLAAVAAKQAMPDMPQRHRPQRNARHGQARAAQLRQAFLNEAPVADEAAVGSTVSIDPNSSFVKTLVDGVAVHGAPATAAPVVYLMAKQRVAKCTQKQRQEDGYWFKVHGGWLHGGAPLVAGGAVHGVLPVVLTSKERADACWKAEEAERRRISTAYAKQLVQNTGLRTSRALATKAKALCDRDPDTYFRPSYAADADDADAAAPDLSAPPPSIAESIERLTPAALARGLADHARRQSTPPTALLALASKLHEVVHMRPTLWRALGLDILPDESEALAVNELVYAAGRGEIKVVRAIMKRPPKASQKVCLADGLHSLLGCGALHAAAEFGRLDVVAALLAETPFGTSASVDNRDRGGRTALHCAASHNRLRVIQALLEAGAERDALDAADRTPRVAAREALNKEAELMLRAPPPAPAWFHANVVTPTCIAVRWSLPEIPPSTHAPLDGASVVYRSRCRKHKTEGGAPPAEMKDAVPWSTGGGIASEWTVKGLEPATGYDVRLELHSAAGWGEPSKTIVQYTGACPPACPGPPRLVRCEKEELLVEWSPPSKRHGAPINLYELQYWNAAHVGLAEEAGDEAGVEAGAEANADADADADAPGSSAKALATSTAPGIPPALDEGGEPKTYPNNVPRKHVREVRVANTKDRWTLLEHLPAKSQWFARIRGRNTHGWGPFSEDAGPLLTGEPMKVVGVASDGISLRWEPLIASADFQKEPDETSSLLASTMARPRPTAKAAAAAKAAAEATGPLYELQLREVSAAALGSMREDAYVTVATTPKTAHFVAGLEPAHRYQCRVRARLPDGTWMEWRRGASTPLVTTKPSPPLPPAAPALAGQEVVMGDDAHLHDDGAYESEDESDGGGYSGAATLRAIAKIRVVQGAMRGAPHTSTVLEVARIEADRGDDSRWVDAAPRRITMPAGVVARSVSLMPGAAYEVRARSSNAVGASEWSDALRFTTWAADPPPPPRFTGKVSASFLGVAWDVPTLLESLDVREWELQWRAEHPTAPGAWRTEAVPGDGGVRAHTAEGLGSSTPYVARVRARVAHGWSGWSDLSEPRTTHAGHGIGGAGQSPLRAEKVYDQRGAEGPDGAESRYLEEARVLDF